MNRIANPYNIHTLYNSQMWDEAQHCPLYCGTRNLPPTQLKLALSTSGSSYSAYIQNPESGYSLDVTSKLSRTCTTAGAFYTYSDSNLSPFLDEGMYQLKIQVGATEYYGHPYCALEAYSLLFLPIPTVSCSGTSGAYGFTFSITNEKDSFAYKWEYDNGSGYQQFGSGSSGTLTQDSLGTTGTISANLRISAYIGNEWIYRLYSISFDADDPCGTYLGISENGSGGTGLDKFARLEWRNASDLQGLGVMYADYTQYFYFQPEQAFPVPIIQDTFTENGEEGLFLESALVAEQVNLDFYPLPAASVHALAAVRFHSSVFVRAIWDQRSDTPVNFQFQPSSIEQSLCQRGRFSYERNRAWVDGCGEDYTTQSCS